MPQYLKDETQARIAAAALEVFARSGYRGATMAEIGRRAGVSTGNIYRYYENKDVLFAELVDEAFAQALLALLRRRVEALAGVDDPGALAPTAPFHAASEALLRFCVANRLRVVILLARAEGTPLAGFADLLVATLTRLAVAHFQRRSPELRISETLAFNLDQIYRNLVRSMVDTLVRFDQEAQIRQAVAEFSRYHLGGLQALFA